MKLLDSLRKASSAAGRSGGVFVRDVGQGLLEVGHNTFAVVGLVVVATAAFVVGQPELRQQAEQQAFGWLQARIDARLPPPAEPTLLQLLAEPTAVARATATDPKELTKEQAHVAQWLSRRYRVAPEPISRLVKEAWSVGTRAKLEPTLILAIMAIESSFNPFAQSSVGAQGLMQVMTRVHDDKYEAFGGNHAAFDPVTNLRVGVQVLKECISRAGGVEAGLKFYVGAANLETDGGYAAKVLAEQQRLKQVAAGKNVPTFTAPALTASAAPAKPATPTQAAASADAEPTSSITTPIPSPAASPSSGEDASKVAYLQP